MLTEWLCVVPTLKKLLHQLNKHNIMSKEQQILEKYKALHIGGVSVSLPSVDDAGIIAVEISEINNEMTAQEQAFFIAGFQECVKYLNMQSNER